MTVAEYIVKCLVKNNVTDIFGIPGGVILDFIYAANASDKMNIHLSAHEQAAGFAASGYAQASGRLGVSYATRGPGFANLMTPIADAYFDSHPVLFITSHTKLFCETDRRFEEEQEFDVVANVSKITKYVARIETISEVEEKIACALHAVLQGRRGSVVLDVFTSLWSKEIDAEPVIVKEVSKIGNKSCAEFCSQLNSALEISRNPVLLIGNGVSAGDASEYVIELAEKLKLPVLSSSISVDAVSSSKNYFGYVGSHGLRHANYILFQSDLILSLGNRLAFNINSESFGKIGRKKIIRIDVDEKEKKDDFPNEEFIHVDLRAVLPYIAENCGVIKEKSEWFDFCLKIKDLFSDCDITENTARISSVLKIAPNNAIFTSDVGDNEFFLLQSYVYSGVKNRLLALKSFATLGSSLPKAIGAYYASGRTVISFMGDQAALFNIQELHFIARHNLPIKIVILNNYESGMIKSKQKSQKRKKYLHVTKNDGYLSADFKKIAYGFGLEHYDFDEIPKSELVQILSSNKPAVVELKLDGNIELPFLPKGNICYDFLPKLSVEKTDALQRLEREY